jgi:glycosyltransferase involved in cell wall biosynthesis
VNGEPPPITIGMPVYNGERYLAGAIEAILAQTFADFALVVSDNASNDSTPEIVHEYAERDSRVLYLGHRENRGATWNFNRAFAECRSPLFKWAAADDLLAPTCLERSFEMLGGAPRDGNVLAAPLTRWIDSDGSLLRDGDDRMDVTEATPHERIRHVVSKITWGNTLFALIVADTLRRTRGLGNYPSSDWVLLSELSLAGRFQVVPEPLFLRREHEAMSRKSQATSLELAQWHDPSNIKPEHELKRVFVELLAGIKNAPLPSGEKALCYGFAVAAWTRRHAIPPRYRRSARRKTA